ncbi:MAG: phosphoglycerate kinase [Actinobacteria bacterium]|uniref:phosphoglycerate kinase n=1 Tax=freshwater metagenome TaxID=449393 RepID=A0A6J6M0M5_9ZZZZ|nr:phosphoglycerate kinase [Actinomycetota bacterium]
MRTLSDLGDLAGKRVMLRVDFNVPLTNGVIVDDGRIRAALPTIKQLLELGASVIICSHLGRPEGTIKPEFSLAPVAARLGELLNQEVIFSKDSVGTDASSVAKELVPGNVAVLENLRFEDAETSKDAETRMAFAKKLANLADVFVSDGFGVVHRKHASVYELASLLPSAAGLLVEAEVKILQALTVSDSKPYTVVLGGSKVSDKLAVIGSLLPKIDNLVVGGGMLFTFLAAKGYKVAASLLEQDQIPVVKQYMDQAETLGVKIILPTDIRMASKFAADAEIEIAPSDALEATSFGESGIGLDIGPESEVAFTKIIEEAKICFWNGPMGVFEMERFASGTLAVASALSRVKGLSVVGGGDSAAAVRALGFSEGDFGHISTGGGASLEYLEGKSLPGLEVLN